MRSSARRSTTPPARHSTRARGCSASAIRAARRSSGWLATATRDAFEFPTATRAGRPRLLVRGAEDRPALQGPGSRARRPSARRADLAASYQRAIVESLAIRVERALAQTGLERLSIGGGVAANGPVRERMRALGVDAPRSAARAVHRQRRDDRERGSLRRRAALPGLPRPRRLRDRRADADAR